jgi:hypothetical protein
MIPALPEDNQIASRMVARACRKAALSTLDQEGSPYVSLVTLAFDHDLSPILLISGMSAHTKNMVADARVGFLFDGTDGHPNPQTGPRLSLQGKAVKLDPSDEEARLRARFLARNPAAQGYASFGDFSVWKVEPTRAQFVGGFGRAVWIDAPFGLSQETIHDFKTGEADLLARIKTEILPDIVSIDPDGYDVLTDEGWSRNTFSHPAQSLDEAFKQVQ